MPRFEPFAGYRYDAARVSLDDVVAPPYDVVGPAERAQLAAASPVNAIEVELPEPDEAAGLDRYEHAAALLEAWIANGTLVRDDTPAFSVYRMTYADDDGRRRSTTGVIGALGIDLDGSGDVLPHEETMPKPKGDRLDLLRATRTNLSPIWALSPVEGLTTTCAAAVEGIAPAVARDGEIVHECWSVSDPSVVKEITALVAEAPVLVADGHHRYETAGAYWRERSAAGTLAAGGPEELVMALTVELVEEQLLVRPIHRLVTELPPDVDLATALEPWFDVAAGPDGPDELAHAMAAQGALGLATPAGAYLLTPRAGLDEATGAALDSARLGVALAQLPPHEVTYQHGRTTVFTAGRTGEAQGAFLLRPATVQQIADTARSGRRMPPKTTFFEPKPRTGMVFRPLD